jgi:ABC-type nickel/cobalt efflux system permease component RcnA
MNPSDDIIGLLNVIAALLLIIIGMMFYVARLLKERDASKAVNLKALHAYKQAEAHSLSVAHQIGYEAGNAPDFLAEAEKEVNARVAALMEASLFGKMK